MTQTPDMESAQGKGLIPKHVAIIMDGNGRWARQRHKPRVAGHRAGVTVLRDIVEHAARRGIIALTAFAFSSENWQRPRPEVSLLMDLFMNSLRQEVQRLHDNNVRLVFIGDRSAFSGDLTAAIAAAETLTADNDGLLLAIAANYGGRRDIVSGARHLAEAVSRGELAPEHVTESTLQAALSLHDAPEPDLFIRTGGEQRISNFLLWQLAYTELYFTDCLWPDFDAAAFDEAIAWFASRQRRFGRTGEQVGKDA
ncbi:MAG: isoprenyl transferase [Gammaproteobacteria bacterium]|nr:isoprenyl transferase [Gammaproteobacteria bacterium]